MKRNFVCFVLFVMAFCCLPVLGLDFMGAPCADLQQGQYSIGFNYSYSDMDIDIKGSYFGNYLGSVIELPEELKRLYGDRMCFHGGVDVQQVLPRATPAELEALVTRLVGVLGEGGGYILAPTHNIQVDTPPANIVAIYRAVGSLSATPS